MLALLYSGQLWAFKEGVEEEAGHGPRGLHSGAMFGALQAVKGTTSAKDLFNDPTKGGNVPQVRERTMPSVPSPQSTRGERSAWKYNVATTARPLATTGGHHHSWSPSVPPYARSHAFVSCV